MNLKELDMTLKEIRDMVTTVLIAILFFIATMAVIVTTHRSTMKCIKSGSTRSNSRCIATD